MRKGKLEINLFFSIIALILVISFFSGNSNFTIPLSEKSNNDIKEVEINSNPIDNGVNYSQISYFDDNYRKTAAEDLFISDDLAFLATGSEGLIIFNISNKINPQQINQLKFINQVNCVYVVDNLVYLTVEDSGVQILDITNVTDIINVGYFSLLRANQIYVEGDFAYVGYNYGAIGSTALIVLDISCVTSPYEVYRYIGESYGNINEICIDSNILILVCNAAVLAFDISDLYNLVEVEVDFGYNPILNFHIIGNLFYAASEFYGVIIYDISSIDSIELLGRYQGISPLDIFVKDDYAYVISKTLGLVVLDVSDPGNPQLVTENSIGNKKTNIQIVSNYAFIAENNLLLQVYDLQIPTNPELVFNYTKSGYSEGIAFSDDVVFIADKSQGVEILSISNKLSPEKIADYQESNIMVRDVVFSNDALFLADDFFGLIIVNITDITNPQKIANYTNGGRETKILVQEDIAYLVDLQDGLEIYNISNYEAPTLVFTHNKENITDLYIEDQLLYLSIENIGFDILNISNIMSPSILCEYSDTLNAFGLVIKENTLYLANGPDGVEEFDISDLYAPVKLSTSVSNYYTEEIYINNNCIYLTNPDNGLKVIDEATYDDLGEYNNFGEMEELNFDGSTIYIADGYENLEIIGLDGDQDNLADYLELIYGTNPFITDTDSDNIGDGWEVLIYNLNPLTNDTDFDLMGDSFELYYSLNPHVDDSAIDLDIDNLTNLEEFQYDTNPRKIDSDDDFLTDYQEIIVYKTNPNSADTDGDGWSDSWEVYYNTDPLDPLDFPDFETTPPLTESPPTTPYETGGKFSYYYLFIPVGILLIIALVVFLVSKNRKPSIV